MNEAKHGPGVCVRDVSLAFPGIAVLESIDIDVQPGEFVCFVGPSGCGKTTLLNIISGFLNPTNGEVLVGGETVRGPDPRRMFIFQEGGVFPWLTVAQNIGFARNGETKEERERIVQHYIDMVGLSGFEGVYPRELSGGMRQRVEIARALTSGAEALYMDEPFGALDYFTRMKMREDLLRIWKQERKTVLFVTHEIDEAIQLADRIVVLGARPARVQRVVSVDLDRPRHPDLATYLDIRTQILAAIGHNFDRR